MPQRGFFGPGAANEHDTGYEIVEENEEREFIINPDEVATDKGDMQGPG
jgi:hypothetical protein